jgi:hypothetical protein
MANKPTRGRNLSLHQAVAVLQRSDSETESDVDESLDEEDDASVGQDSNLENSESQSEDLSLEESDSEPQLRRRRTNNLPPAEFLTSKNGQIKWSLNATPVAQTAAANVLTQSEGLTALGKTCTNMAHGFGFFMSRDMVTLIMRETNRQANACVSEWNNVHPNADHQRVWIDTDEVELCAFMGLLIHAGSQKSSKENLDDLWSAKYGRPIYRATMSLTRFKELMRFCRFDNHVTREARKATDKLAPIRDLWEMFQASLPRAYKPGSDVTVDEQLVVSRGRFSFRQYIPSKPGKYGIKIFWACDSRTSYPLKGEVYVGRQPGAAANANNVSDLVKRLVRPWQNTGRNITMDNYFTSYNLATDLLLVRTTVVGTMRKNRPEIPKELLPARGRAEMSSIFCFSGPVTLASYVPKKNKAVVVLSTMHHDAQIDINIESKPEIILHYNNTKSGVDNLDHLVGLYSCKRKTRRWPMTLFFNIIDCACVAAYVTWTAKNSEWKQNNTHKRRLFLRGLSEELVEDHIQRRLQNPQAMQAQVKFALKALGFQLPVPAATDHPAGGQKRCGLCPRSSDRKVKSRCTTCGIACCPEHSRLVCVNCADAHDDD